MNQAEGVSSTKASVSAEEAGLAGSSAVIWARADRGKAQAAERARIANDNLFVGLFMKAPVLDTPVVDPC
jgi:hypothetical protein